MHRLLQCAHRQFQGSSRWFLRLARPEIAEAGGRRSKFSSSPWYISPTDSLYVDRRFTRSPIPLCVAFDIDNVHFPRKFEINKAVEKIQSCFSRLNIKTDLHTATSYGDRDELSPDMIHAMEKANIPVLQARGNDVADHHLLTAVEAFVDSLQGKNGAVFLSTGDAGFAERIATISAQGNIFVALGLPIYSQLIPSDLYSCPMVIFPFPDIYLGDLVSCPTPPPEIVRQKKGGEVVLWEKIADLLRLHGTLRVFEVSDKYSKAFGDKVRFAKVEQLGGTGRCFALYVVHNMKGMAELFEDRRESMKTLSIRFCCSELA